MKHKLLLACLLYSINCNAQKAPIFMYGELGGGGGTGASVKLGLNSLFLKNNIVSIGLYAYSEKAHNVPADYQPGLVILGDGTPTYSMVLLTLMYGKMLFVPGEDRVRFSLKGGLAAGTLSDPENFTPYQSTGWFSFGGNYDYTQVEHTMVGIILNPSMELAITRGFGVRLGITSVISSYSTTVNLEGSILFGKLRHRRRHYPKTTHEQHTGYHNGDNDNSAF